MNKVQILGTMTRDCEIRYTQSGTAIGSFSVAHNEKKKGQDGQYQDVVHFFNVTAWGKTAENINQYFKKGSRILIDGRLDYQSWEKDGQKKSKVGIVVEKFDFIDRKSDSQSGENYSQPSPAQNTHASQPAPSNIPEIDIDSDEIPF